MDQKFSQQLDIYMRQTSLPLRRVASQSGIPHQTIFNWTKGTQPRQYAALSEDLQRLGAALGLRQDEITLLLSLAGCISARSGLLAGQEVPMESALRIPKGWFDSGESQQSYELGVDPAVTYQGKPCVTIKAGPQPSEFGALAQKIKADAYRGKRLRFSAAMRSVGLENRAALFMRVSATDGKILAFDNMRERFISGTNDWARHAIVLDVAEEAGEILFGILSSQQGQVWMADARIDVVDRDVPTTDLLAEISAYYPVNLNFEE